MSTDPASPTDLELHLIHLADERLATVPPSVAQFAVERMPTMERIVRAAQEWREDELQGRDATEALCRLRDVLDREAGVGVGQTFGGGR